MRVRVNAGSTGRRLVECALVKWNEKTVWVELPGKSGHEPAIVKRKIGRDVPVEERLR